MILAELLEGLDYFILQGDDQINVTDLVCDSRKITIGSVFVCVKGIHTDGHTLLTEVRKCGASAVIVDHPVERLTGLTIIQVSNTRYAMALMASTWYNHADRKLCLIGVTGTKGKTTTCYMIRQILEEAGYICGQMGTVEVRIGEHSYPATHTTPEALELHWYLWQMESMGCQYVVMEVSSQALKMFRTAGLNFDIGIFTNLSRDHIAPGEHASMEEYISCKKMLFSQCKLAIVNKDDSCSQIMVEGSSAKIYTYGRGPADLSFEDAFEQSLEVSLPGEFNRYNALAAALTCKCLHIEDVYIQRALKKVQVPGRMEVVPILGHGKVYVDYAHNEASLERLLQSVRGFCKGNIYTVFGCGGNRAKDRRYEMGRVSGELSYMTIITSDNPRYEKPEDIIEDIVTGIRKTRGRYVTITDRKEAIKYALSKAEDEDIILVVGKGHETYQEIQGTKVYMDDRVLIKQADEELKEEYVRRHHS